jgi:uncharacterized membrane protein (DUF4010 family)
MDESGAAGFPAQDFAIALFIGALVGIEREMSATGERGLAGIRTFILFALVGATAAWMSRALESPWPFVAGVLSVAGLVVAGYAMQRREDGSAPGLTTEVAAVAVCLLAGIAVHGARELAVALGISVSAVLAYKEPIHGLVDKIGRDDLYAGLKLLIAAFIVLPLLPDKTFDPWGAANPQKIGLLVVLISLISLLGYVAVRVFGATHGYALTGLLGGLVSSTAVTLGFARKSREDGAAGTEDAIAGGVLLAWTVMYPRLGVVVVLVHPPLLGTIWVPLAAMCAGTLAVTGVLLRRAARKGAPAQAAAPSATGSAEAVRIKNPFRITEAVKFALFLTLIVLVVQLAREYLPPGGLYAVAGLAGTTDVDAISLSMADMASRGGAVTTAVIAILVAVISNTLTKAGIVAALGSPAMRNRVAVGAAASVACGALAAALT